MKLITNEQRQEIALAQQNDARSIEVRNRWGDADKLAQAWSPRNVQAIAARAGQSVAAGVPTLVAMLKAYGQDTIKAIIATALRGIVVQGKETQVEDADINTIATLMCQTKAVRLVDFAHLFEFIAKLAQGEFECYSMRPRQVMRCFQEYCKSARQDQYQQKLELEQRERSRAHAEMLKNSVTFEEWAKNAPQSLLEGVDVEFIKKQIKGA